MAANHNSKQSTKSNGKATAGYAIVGTKGASVGFITVIAVLVIASFYGFWLSLNATQEVMRGVFASLGAGFAVVAILLLVKQFYTGIYLFEPFTMVTLVYVLVFFVAPLIQFKAGNYVRYSVDVTPWAGIGTIIAIGAYLAFFLGYELSSVRGKRGRLHFPYFRMNMSDRNAKQIVQIACAIWIFCYVLTVLNWLMRGYGLAYVLTGGIGGEPVTDRADDSLAFLTYCKYSLTTCWLVIFLYGKNKALKIILMLLTLEINFFGGARAALIIPMLAPFVWYYTKNKTSPSAGKVFAAIAFLLVLFGIMQTVRAGISSGTGFSLDGQTLDSVFEPFLMEIEDYKAYFALLPVIPSRHEFLYGAQMIGYSLITLVPRAVFPGKPDPPVHEIIYMTLGEKAMKDGVAYPCLGELYIEFGIPGCLIGMLVFGIVLKKLSSLYLEAEDKSLAMVFYAVLYPALFQLIIRGYMPQNFTMLLFTLFPLLVLGHFNKVNLKKLDAMQMGGDI